MRTIPILTIAALASFVASGEDNGSCTISDVILQYRLNTVPKLLRKFISFYHKCLQRRGMWFSPQHPGPSSLLVTLFKG